MLMTNILAWIIKTSVIHSRIFTWAVGSPWMKGLSSFSGVRVRIGRSFGSSTWGMFNVDAHTEKSSSYSCQLELYLVFSLKGGVVRGELQHRTMERVNTWIQMTTTVNTSKLAHWKYWAESKERQSWLKHSVSQSDWDVLQCNKLHDTESCVEIVCCALVWANIGLVVHCMDADKLLFQTTVVMIVRSRWMLIKLAHEQCFMT